MADWELAVSGQTFAIPIPNLPRKEEGVKNLPLGDKTVVRLKPLGSSPNKPRLCQPGDTYLWANIAIMVIKLHNCTHVKPPFICQAF
jgi:hypothetical protein